MSTVTKTALKAKFQNGDFPTEQDFIDFIDTVYPYEKWDALMTQAGTAAPTFTINANTLGGTISWAYTAVGVYRGTLTGAFLTGKVEIFISPNSSMLIGWRRLTDSLIEVSSYDNLAANTNGLFNNTAIEIRVYPT